MYFEIEEDNSSTSGPRDAANGEPDCALFDQREWRGVVRGMGDPFLVSFMNVETQP